ncbi:choice-of-anchor G family protein, partial [Corynebacterium casei]|uniref:choice-of-anchor G family protein n=1 Tax=Corynebacterium casei TaxID=160386 RepID=UPI003F9DBFBF
MRHDTSSSRKLSRWMRVSIATVTSTALVAGVAVAAPSIPSFPTAQAAEAQSIPANADAYAASTQLDLSAPGVRAVLTTDDSRGVDEILTLLEAEQSWISDSDDEQEPDLSNIELELLELLKLDIGGVEVPLIGSDGLLQGDLGALRAYANAPSDTHAKASVGLVGEDGALELGNEGDGGNAKLDLTKIANIDLTNVLLDEASLNLGTLSSLAEKNGTQLTSDYQIAEAEVVIDSPLVGEVVTEVEDLVEGLDGTLNGLLGQQSVLSEVFGLVNGLGALVGTGLNVSAEIPLDDIMSELVEEPLSDQNGLVSIDLVNGQIRVDLEKLHAEGLNNLEANTELLTAQQLGQITDTVTSLLTDGAVENPNGLNARLQDILMGNGERGGLYGTEVQVQLRLLGPLAGLDLRTTLGGLLNENAEEADSVAEYDSDKYNYYLQETVGLGVIIGGLLDLVRPVLGAVGTVVEDLLFGDETQEGLVSGLLGSVQDGVLQPVLNRLDPLLVGVLNPVLGIIVNRQETVDGLFKVSALQVDVLSGTLLLPIANSAVISLDESVPPTTEPSEPTTEPSEPTTEPT